MAFEGTEQLLARTQNFVDDHRALYLSTGGAKGHIVGMAHAGADRLCPTLLLKTVGRKTGRTLIAPLIYGTIDGTWVIVASKGGAPEHPAWFLNIQERTEVEFQVATQAFRATWHLAQGEERQGVWEYMARVYPPYKEYALASQGREIPVVLMKPVEEIAVFGA